MKSDRRKNEKEKDAEGRVYDLRSSIYTQETVKKKTKGDWSEKKKRETKTPLLPSDLWEYAIATNTTNAPYSTVKRIILILLYHRRLISRGHSTQIESTNNKSPNWLTNCYKHKWVVRKKTGKKSKRGSWEDIGTGGTPNRLVSLLQYVCSLFAFNRWHRLLWLQGFCFFLIGPLWVRQQSITKPHTKPPKRRHKILHIYKGGEL